MSEQILQNQTNGEALNNAVAVKSDVEQFNLKTEQTPDNVNVDAVFNTGLDQDNEQAPNDQMKSTNEEVGEEQNKSNFIGESGEETTKNVNKYGDNETYKFFLARGLNEDVAVHLMEMFEALNLTTIEFDERAIELLATFTPDQGKFIINELLHSKLYGVQNKPQYLMSVMRNFKERLRTIGPQQSTNLPLVPGPDPEKIKAIIDRTGYQLEVTVGQRKYFTPLSEAQLADGVDPTNTGGCIYIGQIPKDVYEDQLIPLFEEIGKIYDLRIMMDPINGKSRGYGFLIYFDRECATEAAKKYDGHHITGKALKVNVSIANTRLFIGNIPKSKSKDEILEEFRKHAENVVDVIIYSNPDAPDSRKNRGFCFIDFSDHKAASDAKRRISMGKIRPWNNDLVVDWAEQQEDPDDDIMSQVKVLYVRNLKESVSEERLKEIFEKYGEVEKAKRMKDYAFIHFKERPAAVSAMESLHKSTLDDVEIEVSLAKPQNEQKKKKFQMKRGMGDYFQGPSRGGRSNYEFYPPAPRGRGAFGYPKPYAHNNATPGPYEPYSYGGGGGGEYGYPGDYGYGGYEEYADPYYNSYQPPYPYRGNAGYYRPRGSYGGGRPASRGGGLKRGGSRGVKRTGGDFGGPNPKKMHDFSSDITF